MIVILQHTNTNLSNIPSFKGNYYSQLQMIRHDNNELKNMVVSQLVEELTDANHNVLLISSYDNIMQMDTYAEWRAKYRGQLKPNHDHFNLFNDLSCLVIDECEVLKVHSICQLIRNRDIDRAILDVELDQITPTFLSFMEFMCVAYRLDVELLCFKPEALSPEFRYKNEATLRLQSRWLDTTDSNRAQVATVVHNRKELEDYYLIRPYYAFIQQEI